MGIKMHAIKSAKWFTVKGGEIYGMQSVRSQLPGIASPEPPSQATSQSENPKIHQPKHQSSKHFRFLLWCRRAWWTGQWIGFKLWNPLKANMQIAFQLGSCFLAKSVMCCVFCKSYFQFAFRSWGGSGLRRRFAVSGRISLPACIYMLIKRVLFTKSPHLITNGWRSRLPQKKIWVDYLVSLGLPSFTQNPLQIEEGN